MKTIFLLLAWVIASIAISSSAQALTLIPGLQDVKEVRVTNKWRPVVSTVCGHTFSYQQLMAIPGNGAVWVTVESVYSPGPKEVFLQESCENEGYIYGVGDCNC